MLSQDSPSDPSDLGPDCGQQVHGSPVQETFLVLPGLSLCTPHAGGPFPSLGRELDPTSLTKSSNAANEDPTHPNKCFLKRGGEGDLRIPSLHSKASPSG